MAAIKCSKVRQRAASFCEDHLVHLRPLKVGSRNREERFVFPEVGDLKGTSFELCADEVSFVNGLIGGQANQGMRRHNLWLYRTDQQRNAGDFVLIDVSSPPRRIGPLQVPCWDVFILDLKMNGRFQLGGSGAGFQLNDWERAAESAITTTARTRGVLPEPHQGLGLWHRLVEPRCVWRIVGDRRDVLSFFRNLRLMRRLRRRVGDDPRTLEGLFEALC